MTAITGKEQFEAMLTRVRASLQDTSTADLVDAAAIARQDADASRKIAELMEGELMRRRGDASLLVGGEHTAELTPGAASYEWDAKGVLAFLIESRIDKWWDYVASIPPPVENTLKVDTRKVLALAKKLGKEEEVAAFYQRKENAPKWKFGARGESK